MKCEASQELVVGGFTDPQGGARRPRRAAGRLLRGRRLRLRRQGRHRLRHEAAARPARAARRARDPEAAVHESRRAAAPARALGAARDRRAGRLHRVDGARQASPLRGCSGIRTDKAAARGREGDAVITHPEKVLFPDDGDHQGRARRLLRGDRAAHAAAHPRPSGHDGALSRPASAQKGFFQKDVSKGFPDWLERVEVPKKDGTVHYPLVTDTRSLLWLANQNSITPHVWTSRAPDLYQPDLCVFDLDPSEDEPDVLRAAALALRDLLDELGLPSWVKTSGSKGFHIVVPLDGKAGLRRGRAVRARRRRAARRRAIRSTSRRSSARPIAAAASSSTPAATATARRSPRPTPCAPKPGAPVSAPCTWEEVERGDVGPRTFTLRDDGGAHRRRRRPVVGPGGSGQALTGAIERLRELQ